ncbi:hypothetical protein PHYSODRAFT_507682 [Phytophthora sojae]|uniref:Pentacotripeptide-repeat region of PRORP domain-containing protein n=1 Tax=Phytophthora sojae (strain P6497) TaxID=1094619 RepID=G4ZPS2_PHYSP|nr:hypothetical protein PHYSODRAFT_507682 [Phytophthora sojae]EGZ16134.1 hypothetical protein PHYSODRAFT_507682 [Phytophthora sojae]|eukprot:XP_009529883.1 hypothetical protein PHYSODRAFT_507682 [Phytophthora sojae]
MWRRLAAAVARRSPNAPRVDVLRLRTCRPLALSCSQHLLVSGRPFSSRDRDASRVNDVKVRDIELRELVRRPWIEMQEYYGPVEMAKVAPEIVEDFYEAARVCRLSKLQRDVFDYMEAHYLERISFEMYGQMFNILTFAKDPQRMRAIFERAMTRYDPEQGQVPPEIVYRLGITAAIALKDYVGVKMLVRDMETKGAKPSVEIVSRVMVAQAQSGDAKTVLAAAEKLNPQDGRKWHEADINRIITSLGIAGEPDAAFDFYRKSQMRLSPQTCMKLMLVCRGNSRPKHAFAILANRRRFGLKMSPFQYPTLLEIIEELGIAGAPGNEMALILKEMRDNSVQFNDRVHALIARNQQHLHGTAFMLTPSISDVGDGKEDGVELEAQARTKEADKPLLRELLDSRKFAQAAAIVNSYLLPVSDDVIKGDRIEEANSVGEEPAIVPDWLADTAIEAYSQNQEVAKVRSLVRGFMCVRGDFKHALSRVVGLFGGNGKQRDSRMVYEAFLAMQVQGFPIFRVRDALTRFKQHQDSKAAFKLLMQVSGQIAEALRDSNCIENAAKHQEDFMRVLERSGELNFDPVRTVRDVLRVLLASKELGIVFAALDQLASDGIPIRSLDYETIFSAMSKANRAGGKVFSVEDFMKVWEDMARRSVAPSKALLRLVIPVLCGNDNMDGISDKRKRRQLAVIEGYQQAAKDRRDNYVLPVACFSTLLESAAETGSVEDVNAIHAGAVRGLGASMNKRHLSLAEHSKILDTWQAIKSEKAAAESDAAQARTEGVEMV